MVIGLSLISHAVNLLVFTSGGLLVGHPPLIPAGAHALPGPFTDPVPQALVLTAIVISFGVLAFAVVLILRAYQSVGTDDLDELTRTDT
jgi:multicomponent Na+:H+ antiporter subunit C